MTQSAVISDVSLYIDELKSDDPIVKINSITRIDKIIESLSIQRVENEFFPYLTFIINETENDDEFLLKLSQNLSQSLEKTPSINKKSAIKIFEPLATLEDTRVRESAISGLVQISKNNTKEILKVANRLAVFSHTSKISCLELLKNIIKERFFDLESIIEIDKLAFFLFNDKSVAVRRAALRLFNQIWLSKKEIKDFSKNHSFLCFLPTTITKIYNLFDNISEESIFYEICDKSFFSVFDLLLDEVQKERLQEKLLESLVKNEINWRIKYMIISNHTIFSNQIKKPSKIAEIFLKLLKSEEQELKCAVLREISSIYSDKTCSRNLQQFHDLIINCIKVDLSKDKNTYIRENFVHLLQNMLNSESQNNNIKIFAIEVFLESFQNFVQETKMYGFDFIETLFCGKDFQKNIEVLDKLESIASQKNWKMRMVFLEKLENVIKEIKPCLKNIIGNKKGCYDFLEKCLELQMLFANDHVLIIRKKLIENLISYKGIFEDLRLLKYFEKLFEEWINSRNYIFRISALQSFEKIVVIFDWDEIEEMFRMMVKKIKNDQVPNVRINVLKLMMSMRANIEYKVWKKYAKEVLDCYSNDKDKEVQNLIEKVKEMFNV